MDDTQQLICDAQEEKEEQRGSDREPRGRLRMLTGSQGAETDFMVYGGLNVIGRNENCHIHIPVQSVSKKHAVIEIEGDSHMIHDCNSLNNTRRKNAILKPSVRYQINDGDLFLFGDVACQYLVLPPAAQGADSGSETDSECMLPQPRAPGGTDWREEWTESDPVPETAGSDLESADDSLVLLPTQSHERKLLGQLVQSDVYVKESEDDDTPWKESQSFSSRAAQDPNTSERQTPLANVVPESDDEAENTSHPNIQPARLNYDSDTDLEEDQGLCEEWAECTTKQTADDIAPRSEPLAPAEQVPTPVTGDAMLDRFSATNETSSKEPGGAVERDKGAISSQGPVVPPSADILDTREKEVKQDSAVNNACSMGPTITHLGIGTYTQEAAVASSVTEEEIERHKDNYCASNSPRAQEEANETMGRVEEADGTDVNHDADVDDDTNDFYALQPTQCFVLAVSSTQDETAGEENCTTHGAKTEEEATKVYSYDCPSFKQEPLSAAADNTEEEVTQPFTFQSPTFSKDHYNGDPVTPRSLEEDATQPFNPQSPVFSKEPSQMALTSGSDHGGQLGQGKGGPAAASSEEETETQLLEAEAAGYRAVAAPPSHWRPSERREQERSRSDDEERWASQETQEFCTREQAVEKEGERAGQPEEAFGSPGAIPATCAGHGLALVPPDGPPGTEGGETPATTGPPEALEGGEGGRSHQESRVSAKCWDSEGASRVDPGDEPTAGSRPPGGRGEAADPNPEESSRVTLAAGRAGGRRSRRKPKPADSEAGSECQEEPVIPGVRTRLRSLGSAENGEERSRETGGNARPSRRKTRQLSAKEGAENAPVQATPVRPKRGRGRQKTSPHSSTDDHLCPAEKTPQVSPKRKARRRSVAAPPSQTETAQHTDSPPEQRRTGRRTQVCTQPPPQETKLSSGRLRRSRTASQPDNEKETSTPPQIKTRRQACQLSPSSSVASLPEGLALPKVMFTGLVDEDGMKVIMQLGGEVVECVHDSTHLVTDRIRRTVKFLCAVARGIPVVTPEWLKKSGKNSYFLSHRSFLLEDRDQEQNFNFKLKDSLQKAKEQPLLQGYQIHVTAGVQPDPSQMGTIMRCSGATVLPKMPRVYKEKTLVISCPADLPKCQAARDAGIPVVNAEFVLTGILQQTLDLVKYRLDGDEVVESKPEGNGRKQGSTDLPRTQPARAKKKKR